MTRNEWKRQAMAHASAAKILLRERQYSIAYYVAGLAVECALKAQIARSFRTGTWPDREFVNSIHSHNLEHLVRQAQLETARVAEAATSAAFRTYWNTLKDWRIESRYEVWSAAEATDMVTAVVTRSSGALAWIKRHW